MKPSIQADTMTERRQNPETNQSLRSKNTVNWKTQTIETRRLKMSNEKAQKNK